MYVAMFMIKIVVMVQGKCLYYIKEGLKTEATYFSPSFKRAHDFPKRGNDKQVCRDFLEQRKVLLQW